MLNSRQVDPSDREVTEVDREQDGSNAGWSATVRLEGRGAGLMRITLPLQRGSIQRASPIDQLSTQRGGMGAILEGVWKGREGWQL